MVLWPPVQVCQLHDLYPIPVEVSFAGRKLYMWQHLHPFCPNAVRWWCHSTVLPNVDKRNNLRNFEVPYGTLNNVVNENMQIKYGKKSEDRHKRGGERTIKQQLVNVTGTPK